MTSGDDSRGGLLSAGGILSIIVGVCEIIAGGLSIITIAIGTSLLHSQYRLLPDIIKDYSIAILPTWLIIAGAVIIVLGIIALIGGISAIKRKSFGLSLSGAICALLPLNILGVLAVIFVSLGKGEFSTEYSE